MLNKSSLSFQAIHLDFDGNAWSTLVVILAVGGKFAISGAYAVIYLFSTEQVAIHYFMEMNVKHVSIGTDSH